MAKYRNKRTGEIKEVPDPAPAPVEPQVKAAPQDPSRPPHWNNGAPDWANETADTLKSWGNAASMGIMGQVGEMLAPDRKAAQDELAYATSKNPAAATVGAVTSPLNKLMPVGKIGTAARAAAGANYADSIGENPIIGGMTAGVVSSAGNLLSKGAGMAGRLGGFLKGRFGAQAQVPRLPASANGTAVMEGFTENGTSIGIPGKIPKFLDSPEPASGFDFSGLIGKLGGAAGSAISKTAVPVSEAISNAQAMEDEEKRRRYREANGLEK